MKTTLIFLAIFVAFASGQGSEEIPPELRCFLRGFFKCRSGLQSICSEFQGNNRRPVPIPKRRFNGQCPILGTQIPKTDLKDIDLPPCPCTNGNEVKIELLKNVNPYLIFLSFVG